MDTRIVRINGIPFRIIADELPDPHPERPGRACAADEPDNPYGAAVCTLDGHGADIMHIGHDGERRVIAMWGEPAVVTDADLEG